MNTSPGVLSRAFSANVPEYLLDSLRLVTSPPLMSKKIIAGVLILVLEAPLNRDAFAQASYPYQQPAQAVQPNYQPAMPNQPWRSQPWRSQPPYQPWPAQPPPKWSSQPLPAQQWNAQPPSLPSQRVNLTDSVEERNKAEFNRLVSTARQLIGSGNPAMAIEPLNKAAWLRPENLSVYFYRGLAYDESGDPQKAVSDYAKSLELAKSIGMDSAELRINLGNSLMKLNFLKEATYDYERALQIDPRNAFAHQCLGRALLTTGAYKEALKHFRRCDELGYANLSLPYLKSLALFGLGENQEAKEELNAVSNAENLKNNPQLVKMVDDLKNGLK